MIIPKNIPSNQILTKYTSGNEYIEANTYKEYQGYYYELNDKTYAGKTFDVNAPELLKKTSDKINPLLFNPFTAIYGLISKVQPPKNPPPTSFPYSTSSEFKTASPDAITPPTVFYSKKLNEIPHIIKRIDEKTYVSLQNNPLYQTTYVGIYKSITQTTEEAEKQMPGLISFLVD